MKIVKKEIKQKSGDGYIELIPQNEEDIWYLYNIIFPKDVLRVRTQRKVTKKEGDYGVKKISRKTINLIVAVMSVGFESDDKGTSLTLKTKNLSENENVMKGQIQTIEVKLFQKLKIFKNNWDEATLQLVNESTDDTKFIDSLIIMYDDGHAGFYFVKRNFTKLYTTLSSSLPKKRTNMMDIYNKRIEAFDKKVCHYIFETFDINKLKAIVVAGPGIAKARFIDRLKDIDKYEADPDLREKIKANVYKFVAIPTSSTYKSAIEEILKDKRGIKVLEDTKAVKESKKLAEFFDMLQKNPDRAVYGEKEIAIAHREGAIRSLLIVDGLIRSKNFSIRKKYTKLKKELENAGVDIFVFSENHVSGQKLKDITGIAAILKFPVDLSELYEENEDEEIEVDRYSMEDEDTDLLNKSFIVEGASLYNDSNDEAQESDD